MIKIDVNRFDQKAINEIYFDEGLLSTIASKISKCVDRGDVHEIVKELLRIWFCDETGNIDYVRINQYLLDTDPERYIDEFFQKIKEYNAEYYMVLEKWPKVFSEALETNNRQCRKDILTKVITPTTLDMFDGITEADLQAEPKTKTFWSNKHNLKAIKLTFWEDIRKPFEDIFDYDEFSNQYRTKLLGAMKVTVCPYCNRQFITMCEEPDESKATADIDHYFCKDIYPFLALSLYNFIPSCQICNSRFKLAEDFYRCPHINPYRQAFSDDCVFKFKTLKGIIDDADPEYGLVNRTGNVAITNSIETFHLNGVYKSHKDYVKELIMKAKLYNESQITEYLHNFSELFGSTDDLMQLLYGTYLEPGNAGLRPLSKLTQDILKDLGGEIGSD